MPAHKKPAGVIKRPAGSASTGLYRPVFKTGDIAMKAVFDAGVPFSNGMYTAVVNKDSKPAVVEFVRQLAVEDPAEAGACAQKQKQKRFVHTFNLVKSVHSAQFQAQHLRLRRLPMVACPRWAVTAWRPWTPSSLVAFPRWAATARAIRNPPPGPAAALSLVPAQSEPC